MLTLICHHRSILYESGSWRKQAEIGIRKALQRECKASMTVLLVDKFRGSQNKII